MLAKSPKATLYTGVLQPLRYLRDRSDCYRLERQVAGRESHPLKMHAFARHTATRALHHPRHLTANSSERMSA